MADPSDDVVRLWQSQGAAPFRMTTEDIQRRLEAMERKRRRTLYDFYAVFALISIVMIALSVLSPNVLMKIGAALSVAGFGFIAWQVRRHLMAPPPADEAPEASAEVYRGALQKQLDFHRKGLWARIAAIAPGPLLFSIGFAAAWPHAAPIIYVQIATFVLLLAASVPLNRRKAARIQRQIDEVMRLRADGDLTVSRGRL